MKAARMLMVITALCLIVFTACAQRGSMNGDAPASESQSTEPLSQPEPEPPILATEGVPSTDNSAPEEELNDTAEADFSLSFDGQGAKTMRISDTLGDWTLSDLQISRYSDDEAISMVRATFVGDVTLRGTVTRNCLMEEEGYDFTVAKEDESKMPHYIPLDMDSKDETSFIMEFSEELGNPVSLNGEESLDCTITLSDYRFIFAYMMAPASATVVGMEVVG